MEKNIVTLTDSYKMTHHNQYDKHTEYVYSYFEARPGARFDTTTFFGLQYIIKTWLEGEVVTTEDIDRAEKMASRHFGNSDIFDRSRWDYIVEKHNGRLPIEIKAVPEGSVVHIDNVMMTVVNTDPKCYWLTNHLETLLCQVWYPSTVATLSGKVKDIFKQYLNVTSDFGEYFPGLNFMLHDFGMRGVSSMESAAIGGAGHLVNFSGTDTVIAMEMIEQYYGGFETGFSVPATEHSVMTAKGEDGEKEVIKQLIESYPTGLLSVVSDSYDIYRCVDQYYGVDFKEDILARDGKFVVRPDSGNPVTVVCGDISIEDWTQYFVDGEYDDTIAKSLAEETAQDIIADETAHGECGDIEVTITFKVGDKTYKAEVEIEWNRYDKQFYYIDEVNCNHIEEYKLSLKDEGLLNILWRRFGGIVNEKGYKVLNPKIGLIWGDGIDINGIESILRAAQQIGFSAENLVFGMGGGLLQKINRDTQRFAFKSSAQMRDGVWYDVYKDPIEGGKSSKRGRLVLLQNEDDEYITSPLMDDTAEDDLLKTVFINGDIVNEYNFEDIINKSDY